MDAIVKPPVPPRETDEPPRPARAEAESAVRTLIAWAGHDPAREGVLDTPRRVTEAYGELFATLAPDRAVEVRRIGREIGLSRAVCRMNWTADVTDGAETGARLYAAAAATTDFAADLEAARAELAAARAEGLTHPGCAAERRALSQAGRGAVSAP